ncbi:MAG: AI-2E family transporter, partial [Ruminiclostridium sp.]|nr:AI-2E family transporter [Ruminiclostridium sp.]
MTRKGIVMEYTPLIGPQRRLLWMRLGIRTLIFLLVLAFGLLMGFTLLELVMPFLLALLFTAVTEPILRFFHNRWKISRGFLALVMILVVVGALGGIVAALAVKGWREVYALYQDWDRLWETFQGIYRELGTMFDQVLAHFPSNIQDIVHDLSDRLLAWLNELASKLVPKTTSAARSISSFVLAFLFFLLAWFFTASDYPNLRAYVSKHTPESLRHLWNQLRRAFSAA